jgi:hypothetical protein
VGIDSEQGGEQNEVGISANARAGQGITNFRAVLRFKQYWLDRIIRMSGTVDNFRRDPDFDLECFAKFAFESFFSDAEHGLVRWRFTPRAAAVAREFVFHPL